MADLTFDNHAETKNDGMKPLVTGSDMSISQRGFTMKVVKAAAVQLSPVLYSREGTVVP